MLGGVLLTGLRVKLGRFDGEMSGLAKGYPGGVVVDDAAAVGWTDDCSWCQWRFPRDGESVTEREGAKGDEKRRVD